MYEKMVFKYHGRAYSHDICGFLKYQPILYEQMKLDHSLTHPQLLPPPLLFSTQADPFSHTVSIPFGSGYYNILILFSLIISFNYLHGFLVLN